MKLQMLRPRVATVPGRLQMAATLSTRRIRGSALQAIRERILRRDCGICRCAICSRTGAVNVAMEVEHRIPLWAGGAEDDENRYAIARDCHEAKTKCEARMRSAGGWMTTPCTCGHHEGSSEP